MKKIIINNVPVKKYSVSCFITLLILIMTSQLIFSQRLPKSYNFTKGTANTLDLLPKSNTVEKVLMVGDTVWIATEKGLSKSTDHGNSWYNYYGSADFGTESVSTIAFNDGVFYAATWHEEYTETEGYLPAGSGLKISTNYGKSWTSVKQPVDLRTDSTQVYGSNVLSTLPITTTINNFIYDIAITKNTIWIVSLAAGLRKSTNMGTTWYRVPLPPDNLDSIKPTDILNFSLRPKAGNYGNLNHIGYSILSVDNDTLYVGTVGGINKSTDCGISWTKFSHQNQISPISGNHIWRIRQNPVDKSIWAVTWKANADEEFGGVSVTRDGGKSWKITFNDSRSRDFIFPEIKSGSTITGTDVIALTEDGLYRSSNQGSTWITAPKITDSQKHISLLKDYFLGGAVNNQVTPAELWFGSDNGLARLKQATSNFWDGAWDIFFVSEPLNSGNETYAFPNPFTPAKHAVRIKYSLTSSANVTILILDFGMNLVKTVIQNASRNAGNNFEAWDGRDGKGSLVPNGIYFYKVETDNSKPLFNKIMVAR